MTNDQEKVTWPMTKKSRKGNITLKNRVIACDIYGCNGSNELFNTMASNLEGHPKNA